MFWKLKSPKKNSFLETCRENGSIWYTKQNSIFMVVMGVFFNRECFPKPGFSEKEHLFKMWHVVKKLILIPTGPNFVIQKLRRCKVFRSKSGCKKNNSSQSFLSKLQKQWKICRVSRGKRVRTWCFSIYTFFQTLSFQTKFYLNVWHSVSDIVLNPWEFKCCFSRLDKLKNFQLRI